MGVLVEKQRQHRSKRLVHTLKNGECKNKMHMADTGEDETSTCKNISIDMYTTQPAKYSNN